MTNLAVLSMGKGFLLLGLAIAVTLVLIIGMVYLGIYKKCMKGNKSLSVGKLGIWITFIIYLVVVLGATLLRPSYMEPIFYWRLFSSYKAAWVSASYIEWRNLILNILMFVPLGIYLPLLFHRLNKCYQVYGIGMLLSISIEVIQWKRGSGVGEIDDILNNSLGCIIGYGIFLMIYMIGTRKSNISKHSWREALWCQLPLAIIICVFLALFGIYQQKDLGILFCEPTHKVEMENVQLITALELSSDLKESNVYEIHVYDEDALLELATTILEKFGDSVDQDSEDKYTETIVYKSLSGGYSLWVDYSGGGYWLINHELMEDEEDYKLNENEVRDILEEKGIVIPEGASFQVNEGANYRFEIDRLTTDTGLMDGYLTCGISIDGEITEISNYIQQYSKVKEIEIISTEEVYDRISAGDFSYYQLYQLENVTLEVLSISLDYSLDSKGFLQPIYVVEIEGGNLEDLIYIPALK